MKRPGNMPLTLYSRVAELRKQGYVMAGEFARLVPPQRGYAKHMHRVTVWHWGEQGRIGRAFVGQLSDGRSMYMYSRKDALRMRRMWFVK